MNMNLKIEIEKTQEKLEDIRSIFSLKIYLVLNIFKNLLEILMKIVNLIQ